MNYEQQNLVAIGIAKIPPRTPFKHFRIYINSSFHSQTRKIKKAEITLLLGFVVSPPELHFVCRPRRKITKIKSRLQKKTPCPPAHSRLVIHILGPTADGSCGRRLIVALLLCQGVRLARSVRRWRTRRSAIRRPFFYFYVVVRIAIPSSWCSTTKPSSTASSLRSR